MGKLVVIGRRWRDREAGNTYHSVRVYEHDGEEFKCLVHVPFAYGYDDAYKDTAYKALVELGHYTPATINEDRELYKKFHFSLPIGEGNLFTVADVGRKKDL